MNFITTIQGGEIMSDQKLANDNKKFSLTNLLDKVDDKIKNMILDALKETIENFLNDLRKKKEPSEPEDQKEQ